MNFAKMVKVLLVGLGLGFAASAYAASCSQCNSRFDECIDNGSNPPSACHTSFRACKATAPKPCWLY